MYEPWGPELSELRGAIRDYRRCPNEHNFERLEGLCAVLLIDNKSVDGYLVSIRVAGRSAELLDIITMGAESDPSQPIPEATP